jgi:hypothetical protein
MLWPQSLHNGSAVEESGSRLEPEDGRHLEGMRIPILRRPSLTEPRLHFRNVHWQFFGFGLTVTTGIIIRICLEYVHAPSSSRLMAVSSLLSVAPLVLPLILCRVPVQASMMRPEA